MKLDVYQANGTIIRLYDFTHQDLHQLRTDLLDLAHRWRSVIPLHEEPFVQPLGGCRLTLRLGGEDAGIHRAIEPNLFGWVAEHGTWDPYLCELTPQSWDRVSHGVELLLRLRFLCSEHVWLHKQWKCSGSLAWLLSPDGEW